MKPETLERQVAGLREAMEKHRLLLRALVGRIQAQENAFELLEAAYEASEAKS